MGKGLGLHFFCQLFNLHKTHASHLCKSTVSKSVQFDSSLAFVHFDILIKTRYFYSEICVSYNAKFPLLNFFLVYIYILIYKSIYIYIYTFWGFLFYSKLWLQCFCNFYPSKECDKKLRACIHIRTFFPTTVFTRRLLQLK